MECGICAKAFDARREPFCTSCARAKLYGSRIEQAAALLGREKAHTHVEAVVRPGNDGILAALSEDADWDAITAGVKTNSVQCAKEEREAIEKKVRDITDRAVQLRKDIEEYKSLLESRKEANERRRAQLAVQQEQLDKEQARVTEPIHAAVRKARHRLNKVHSRTIDARELLCGGASSVSSLKKTKLPDGKTQFLLRGIPVPSLKDLNGFKDRLNTETLDQTSGTTLLTEPHELISASMDNVCRFLGLCCHYLSVRLPAEIIQPHNDFAHAAILPIASSYKPYLPTYPGSPPSNSENTAKIVPSSDVSKPRLLQLDRPLPQLQKEDSKAAALFIEGVSLLAYDLAWLCRAQGVGPLNAFDEICDLGRNLHQLFPGKDGKDGKVRSPLNRNISTATGKPERSIAETEDGKPKLGSYSHGSSRNSLAGPDSEDQLPEWKLSITKFVDQLKSYLRNEAARAEWHIVDDTEWDEELEHEKPVMVGGMRRSPAMSVMTVKPSDGDDDVMGPTNAAGAAKGNSGWTKVRGRGGED
jgi:hypothetical protein